MKEEEVQAFTSMEITTAVEVATTIMVITTVVYSREIMEDTGTVDTMDITMVMSMEMFRTVLKARRNSAKLSASSARRWAIMQVTVLRGRPMMLPSSTHS